MELSCQEKGENTILHTKNVNGYSESDGNEMTCWMLVEMVKKKPKKPNKPEKESKEDVGKQLTVERQDTIAF